MTKAICKECDEEYRCSSYYYEMKRAEFPDMCYRCRVKDRSDQRCLLDGGWNSTKEKEHLKSVMKETKKFGKHHRNGNHKQSGLQKSKWQKK